MTCFDFIEDGIRNQFPRERADARRLAIELLNGVKPQKDHKDLLKRIRSHIHDRISDYDEQYWLMSTAEGSSAEFFCKNASKMNLTELLVVEYFQSQKLTIQRQQGQKPRWYLLPTNELQLSKRSKGSLDWDFLYGDTTLATHKFFREGGGHQSNQCNDMIRRMLAAQKYLHSHPDSPFRFVALLDCDRQRWIDRVNETLEVSDRLYCCSSDEFIEQEMLRAVLHSQRDVADAAD